MSKQDRKIITITIGITFFVFMLSIIIGIKNAYDNNSPGNIELRETPSPVEAELSKLIIRYENGDVDVIDVSTTTAFYWDKLYIFGAYTSPREIDSAAGRSWRKNCYTQIQFSDGVTLLVFADDNVVVHCLDYPNDEGAFAIGEREYKVYIEGLSPQESRFKVNKYGYLIWANNK